MQRSLLLVSRRTLEASTKRNARLVVNPVRCFASDGSALPESLKRVGVSSIFPNEYPGQNYAFNWCLNGDGVTPLKKAAFRITKDLDLKIAGLAPSKSKATIKAAAATKMPEAGSDALSFEAFDEVSQRTKDLLSLSDKLFCPEGDFPSTRTGVRIITNSATLAPQLMSYLERAPRRDPDSQPITAFVLEGTDEEFSGYAIEEVEDEADDGTLTAKSVAAVVVVGKKPDIKVIVAGLQASQKGLEADEAEREAKRASEAENAEA